LLPEKQGVTNRDSSKAEQTYSVPWPFPLCVAPNPEAIVKWPRVTRRLGEPQIGAAVQGVGGRRGPQRVRPKTSDVYPGGLGVFS
jgi:hypothetical protein